MKTIIGYEKEKKTIAQLKKMLHNADLYRECGVRIPRGLLLNGEPGLGKTVLARSVADEGIALVELRAASCCDDVTGEAVREVFEKAKASAPSVLLLDELDKIACSSDDFFMEDNDKIMKILLQELDSLTNENSVLVVATCNSINDLNKALLRPGRFDRIISLSAPDEETRKSILEYYFGKIKIPKKLDYKYLSRITYGYTGAKIECLANEAGILGMEKDTPCITQTEINTVMNKLNFMSEAEESKLSEDQLYKVAVHEAGHALAALYMMPQCLFGASIVKQGDTMGHIKIVREENKLMSAAELEKEVMVLLGGHVAERVTLGEYLTGSASDIDKALSILQLLADAGVYGYGCMFGPSMSGYDSIKEKIEKLDEETGKLIEEHQDVYDEIVKELMEKEMLTTEELLNIKNRAVSIAAD